MTNQKQKPSEADTYRAWARSCQRKTPRQNILAIARSRLVLNHSVLDADPMLLNVKNGTIDLKSGALCDHKPGDFITKMAGCDYVNDSLCPTWERFLQRVMGGDEELIRYVQAAVGYSLTGLATEQVFFVLYGTGANGKSTFEVVISEMLGDYAQAAPPGLLMAKKHEGHPTELAALCGARFVTATEVNASAQWDEEKVKMLTGGDTIKARRMHEDFWEFRPTHKLWISTNHQPETRDNSIGFWRRVRMIPFTERIPVEEQDPHLLKKLRQELPGVLAWAVKGCLVWQENGLGTSQKVSDATATYRHHQDILGRFLEDCCDQDMTYRVKAQELFTAYASWARLNREMDLSQKQFGERIRERGFEAKKASTIQYLGLRLKKNEGEQALLPAPVRSMAS